MRLSILLFLAILGYVACQSGSGGGGGGGGGGEGAHSPPPLTKEEQEQRAECKEILMEAARKY